MFLPAFLSARSPRTWIFGIVGASALLSAPSSLAADQIVLKYGLMSGTIPVADLAAFAKADESAPSLESYGLSGKEAQNVRTALTKEIKISPKLLDQGLNNPLGDVLLDQLGETIQTPTNSANRQALRAALILSASDDGKISLLETIQKYPTQEVHVDGKRLMSAYNQLSKFESQIRKIMDLMKLL